MAGQILVITWSANLSPMMVRRSWATSVCSLSARGESGCPVEGLNMKLEDGLRSFASWEGEWPVWKREEEREVLGYFKTGIVLDFFFHVRHEVLIQHPHPEYVDVFLHGAQW